MWPFDYFRSKDFENARTILVVDDSPVDLLFSSRSLSRAGYKILEATGGQQALDVAREHIPDLIVLDYMMKDIKGPVVCQTLKHNENTQHIPVVFLTSMDTPYSIVEGFEKGAENYLTKPIRPGELVRTVTRILKDIANGTQPGIVKSYKDLERDHFWEKQS